MTKRQHTVDSVAVTSGGRRGKTLYLPPDPDGENDRRADWAEAAIVRFCDATGTDLALADAVCDLVADLMHWCDRNGQEFDRELARARYHYDAETGVDQSTD
jgi:hypothetical protein